MITRRRSGGLRKAPRVKKFFFEQVKMLAHIYYLFIYVLTDTKNFNFCVMKVKDFIDWIRPITAMNPESELVIYNFQVPVNLKFDRLIIQKDEVTISVLPFYEKSVDELLKDSKDNG